MRHVHTKERPPAQPSKTTLATGNPDAPTMYAVILFLLLRSLMTRTLVSQQTKELQASPSVTSAFQSFRISSSSSSGVFSMTRPFSFAKCNRQMKQ